MLKKIFYALTDAHSEDKDRIVRAFPSSVEADVRTVIAILPFHQDRIKLATGEYRRFDNLVSDWRPQVLRLRAEEIQIPYRIYLNEPQPNELSHFSDRQRIIFNCIYLRHDDGFVRQKHLEKLKGIPEYYICPFSIQLLGEYVIEILEVLDTLITDTVIGQYAELLTSNPLFWQQTQSRMTSYWDAYYRYGNPKLRQYIGQRIVDRLNAAIRSQANG